MGEHLNTVIFEPKYEGVPTTLYPDNTKVGMSSLPDHYKSPSPVGNEPLNHDIYLSPSPVGNEPLNHNIHLSENICSIF